MLATDLRLHAAAELPLLPLGRGLPRRSKWLQRALKWRCRAGWLTSTVVVLLFLSNTSDIDGLWWMICFILILLLVGIAV